MNKLSSCKSYQLADNFLKGSIGNTIVEISKNIDKYTVPYDNYDHIIKSMRSHRHPLSNMIVKSATTGEVRPILLMDPKNVRDKKIHFPSSILAFGSPTGSVSYVDISSGASYVRDSVDRATLLKIKEINLYAYLNLGFIDGHCKRHSSTLNGSSKFIKNVAIAYSRLFTRCIDRTYPISSNMERMSVALFLSAVFCIVTFFEKDVKDAINIAYSAGIGNKAIIESECKLVREGKFEFENIEEFLKLFEYEFDEYIKENTFTLRMVTDLWQKMYRPSSLFTIEHGASFVGMLIVSKNAPVGIFNDKSVKKATASQIDKIQEVLVSTFGK